MEEYKLGMMEQRFADLIWENVPIASGDLVRLCEKEFGWKKSTTYTMLRRLCERGLFGNEGSIVRALMTREEFDGLQSEKFVEEKFEGSLPKFLAAFTMRNKLSDRDIAELKSLIDENTRG